MPTCERCNQYYKFDGHRHVCVTPSDLQAALARAEERAERERDNQKACADSLVKELAREHEAQKKLNSDLFKMMQERDEARRERDAWKVNFEAIQKQSGENWAALHAEREAHAATRKELDDLRKEAVEALELQRDWGPYNYTHRANQANTAIARIQGEKPK